MSITFAVDENNDMYVGKDGNLAMVTDLESVLQCCAHVAKTRLGEVALNTDEGIPYFETVFNGIPNLIQFETAVRAALLQVDGVLEIVSFNTQIIDTTLSYEAVIRTIYGQGIVNG